MPYRCARCSEPAVALLSYDYGAAKVWLDDLDATGNGSGHPLCQRHAGRFTPPVGWSVVDRRVGAAERIVPRAVA